MIITGSFLYDLGVFLITIVALLIGYFKWKLTFWDRVGLPTLNPSIPYGDSKNLFTGKVTITEQFCQFYRDFKRRGLKHGGAYIGPNPLYVPVDLILIKHIILTDFAHFTDHGSYIDEKNDPLSAHLFSLEGAKWRNMRVKLTQTFTSGKIKMMFQTLVDCTEGLKAIMDKCANEQMPVDIKDVLARYTIDVIGSVAFGLECNSLKEPDSDFRRYGKKVLDVTTWVKVKGMLQFFVPHNILKACKYKLTPPDVEEFFMKLTKDTVEYREKNNIYRKDFMHLLLQLKNRGTVSDDEKITAEDHKTEQAGLTLNEMAAQCFAFFVAGYESSSSTMTFLLYELSRNADIQGKLRNEIFEVLAKHNYQLTYAAVMEMTYMDQVLSETLRKYPSLSVLLRKCTQDYTIPGTNILLKRGTDVAVSTMALQTDPDYFPNPEMFDPDRFSAENKKKILPFTYLPFGEGPRICIGLRLGLMQSKVGLATLLSNYRIGLNDKTKTPIKYNKNSFNLAVKDEIYLDIEKLD